MFTKKTYIPILFLFLFITSFGQESVNQKVDSFLEFKKAPNSSDRMFLFFNTPNRYNQNSAYDWKKELEGYLSEAEREKDSASIFEYKIMQSQVFYDLGQYSRSVSISKDLYKSNLDTKLEHKKILLELLDRNYAKLKLYVNQSEVRKEKKELGITTNTTFYDIYSNVGLPRKAMEAYIEEVSKNLNPKDYYANAVYNNNVGNYLRKARSEEVAIDKFINAESFINLYLNDIIEIKTENDLIKGNLLKGVIEGNLGKSHAELKQFDKAIAYLKNSIEIINEYRMGTYSTELIENSLYLAECELQVNNLKDAKTILDKDLSYFETEHQLKKNRLLAAYYDKNGEYSNASLYYKKNIRLRDSINLSEKGIKEQQIEALVQSELENSKALLDQSKQNLAKKSDEMIELDNKIDAIFISLIFTLLGFAGLVYAYLRSIKAQRIIVKQKYIIEASLVEKDSLLKEIHHRVKNNLQMVSSLLSLQTKNTKSKAAIEALEEGKSRVKAMALIHQKLYQNDDLSVIEMQGYIESLVNSIQSVYKKGGHKINITIDAEGVELDIDRAIPFGLILNELVSNSFKYGFPDNDDEHGKIYIHLRKNEVEGFFEYTDNGIGLPENIDERTDSSMGIRLMNRLVNQLQSNLNIDKMPEGVRFWFNFK